MDGSGITVPSRPVGVRPLEDAGGDASKRRSGTPFSTRSVAEAFDQIPRQEMVQEVKVTFSLGTPAVVAAHDVTSSFSRCLLTFLLC